MARNADHFTTDHLTSDLRSRSVRGAAVMFSTNGGRMLIGLATAATLGRLLEPEDFGLVAMVTAVTALFDRVRSAGLGAATIQRASVNHQQVSNLFWFNVTFGVVMTLGFAALAPVLELFYDDDRLAPIAIAMSLTFLITGLTVQHGALLRRQMRYRSVGLIELTSDAVAASAAIIAALAGAQYWSLVVLNLGVLTTRCAGSIIVCRWIPTWPRRGAGVRSMLAFGGQVTTSALLQSMVDRVDRILIGKLVGTAALGYYTRAYFVLMVPIQRFQASLRNVTVPALSRIQDDHGRYRYFHSQATQLLALVLMPGITLAFVSALPLSLTLLGPKWGESAPIIQAFAPGALVVALNLALNWVYLSLGRGRRLMWWTLIETTITLIAIVIGLRWGAVGVALAFSIARVTMWPWAVSFCFSGTFLRWSNLLSVLWRPLLASIVTGTAATIGSMLWFDAWSSPVHLIAIVVSFSLIYAMTLALLPGGIRIIREIITLRNELSVLGNRRSNPAAANQAEEDDGDIGS